MPANQQSMSPANSIILCTAADGTSFPPTRGLSFVSAGDIKVDTAEGETVTIPSGSLAAGIVHPLSITRIYSTGTTASGFVLYR